MTSIDTLVSELQEQKNVSIHKRTLLSRIFPRHFRRGGEAAQFIAGLAQTSGYFPWTVEREERRGRVHIELWYVNPNGKNGAEVTRYVLTYGVRKRRNCSVQS